MKHAIIDIGSNSMHLAVYETQDKNFKILFREKNMAGLAAYVKKGTISAEGIECACEGLLGFKSILDTLKIENVSVFATAALRNIRNTSQALTLIEDSTGWPVKVISGNDEALLSYLGAMQQLQLDNGAFIDVGGSSSEIVTFDMGEAIESVSFPIGSLSLYRKCVKKIIPGESSLKQLHKTISKTFETHTNTFDHHETVVAVGGTARALLKLANFYFSNDEFNTIVTGDQLDELVDHLTSGSNKAINMILKHMPERIHTFIPGLLIIQHAMHLFKADELIVGKYGVREGYLIDRILNADEHDY